MQSNTRIAGEQLALEPGDLVDFWRKPATKDESGWRGPARLIEPPGRSDPETEPTATARWQSRDLRVRTQDLRRALVYLAMLVFASWGTAEHGVNPLKLIIEFADGLGQGHLLRVGWVRADVTHRVNTLTRAVDTSEDVDAVVPCQIIGTAQ